MKLIVSGALVVMLVLSHWLSMVFASELESLRLFHEPAKTSAVDLPAMNNSLNGSAVKPSPIVADRKSMSAARASAQIKYRYNGFIKTKASVFHFVNGVPMTQLKTIELVSTSDAGRSVQLVTQHGYEFTLSVGDEIKVPKGSVGANNQQVVLLPTPVKALEHSKLEDTQ